MFDSLLIDLRFTLRSLRRSPVFTGFAIATLALGIGATTSIFSVISGVLIEPLPYAEPDRLVAIWNRVEDASRVGVSGPDFVDYSEQADLFAGMTNIWATSTNLYGDGEAEGIVMSWVAPEFLSVMGVAPALGRAFRPEDKIRVDLSIFDAEGGAEPPPLSLMISHGLWQRRYGGDSEIIGRTLDLNGQSGVVIGVMPDNFRLHLAPTAGIPTDVDVWTLMPVDLRADMPRAPSGLIRIVGRLRPGVTVEQAQAQMTTIAAQQRSLYASHEAAGLEIDVVPLSQEAVGHVRPVLFMLLGAVGFVLLIACANVGNLLLVRAGQREREIAIRTAIGGGRKRIVVQMLLESVLLGLVGGGLGLYLADLGVGLLVATGPENLPRLENVGTDLTVLGFTMLITLGAVLLFALAPLWVSTKANLSALLKVRERSATRGRQRLRGGLIIAEVALSVVLLIGAGLMLRSFQALGSDDKGFEEDRVLTFEYALPVFSYRRDGSRTAFFRDVSARLRDLPGVLTVGAVNPIPFSSDGSPVGPFALEAGDSDAWLTNRAAYHEIVPGVFETLGIEVLAGRSFELLDNEPGAEPVIIIDRLMAERRFADSDPVGKTMYVASAGLVPEDATPTPARIIGVVEHTKFDGVLDEGRESIYRPHLATGTYLMNFVVKTAGAPELLIPDVRRITREIDPTLPVLRLRSLGEVVSESMAPTRFAMVLLALFAGVALTLAAIGLYGVIAFVVRQRRYEIGLRIALGADRTRILKMVLWGGLRLAGAGLVVGLAAATILGGTLRTLLYGVGQADPITYVAISALLLAVTGLAALVPARRAASVPPAIALRSE